MNKRKKKKKKMFLNLRVLKSILSSAKETINMKKNKTEWSKYSITYISGGSI